MLRRVGPLAVGLVLAGGSAAMGGETLYEGKSAAQLFVIQCGECHKTPRGLAKNASPSFLREHYTTGTEQAAAIAAYVQGAGGGAAPQRPGRAPPTGAASAAPQEPTGPGARQRRGRAEPGAAPPQGPAGAVPGTTPEEAAGAQAARENAARMRRAKRNGRPVPSLEEPGARGAAHVPTMEEGRAPEPAAPTARTAPEKPGQAARYESPGGGAGTGTPSEAPGASTTASTEAAPAEGSGAAKSTAAASPAAASGANAAPAPSAAPVRADDIPD